MLSRLEKVDKRWEDLFSGRLDGLGSKRTLGRRATAEWWGRGMNNLKNCQLYELLYSLL